MSFGKYMAFSAPQSLKWFVYWILFEHTSVSSTCLLIFQICINSLFLNADGVDRRVFIATPTIFLTDGNVPSRFFSDQILLLFLAFHPPWKINFKVIITATYKTRACLPRAISTFLLVITFFLLPVLVASTPVIVLLVTLFLSGGSSENQLTNSLGRIHTWVRA